MNGGWIVIVIQCEKLSTFTEDKLWSGQQKNGWMANGPNGVAVKDIFVVVAVVVSRFMVFWVCKTISVREKITLTRTWIFFYVCDISSSINNLVMVESIPLEFCLPHDMNED